MKFLLVKVACFLGALGGTVALKCYRSSERPCYGDVEACKMIGSGSSEQYEYTCDKDVHRCYISYVSGSANGITMSRRKGACVSPEAKPFENRCYEEDELREVDPEYAMALKPPSLAGVRYDDNWEVCFCGKDLCNGVTQSAISVTVIVVSLFFATVSTLFY